VKSPTPIASYTVRGQLNSVTSYDNAAVGSGSIVNEVTRPYDGYAQLESSEQDHKPSGGYSAGVPTVQYSRAPGNGNGNRLESVTYPDGRVIHTTYGGNHGIESAINRPTGLAKDNSGSVGQALVTYDRMGSGRAAQVAYPEPSLQLDYADSGTSGYAGWDRFGRVVDFHRRSSDRNEPRRARPGHAADRASGQLDHRCQHHELRRRRTRNHTQSPRPGRHRDAL
jgi:hypothetical protein